VARRWHLRRWRYFGSQQPWARGPAAPVNQGRDEVGVQTTGVSLEAWVTGMGRWDGGRLGSGGAGGASDS
jgi:hypothetical protein